MYIIKADGKLLYSPELIDDGYKLISPRMHLEIGVAGSLNFTIPPCNALYDAVAKMKSIITVEQDGEVVFRGRISEESVDTYKQRRIYCEGDLSFLLDSLQGPVNFTGTPFDLFSQLIAAHNAQMDAEKQFTLGDVSGLDTEETFSFTTTSYMDTMNMVQTYLIDLYGGYIQTRTEGGVHYIDYVDGFTDECSQLIEFGVNLLNFESQINAQELCTVLVPLGATGDDGAALTIASVNDGKVYIENTEAVERFGRVYKTYTWENVTDPEELLELGNEYMNGAGLPETLMITAVDMHLLDADVEKIRKGSMVHLKSKPHGLDKRTICASIDADLENGDQTVFTFGLPRQMLKTLAEQAAENAAGLGGVYSDIGDIYTEIDGTQEEVKKVSGKVDDQHLWLTETETALNIAVETLDLIGHRVNQVEIDVDGAEAAITLKANQSSVDVLEQRMSGAEVRIDGAEAAITLKAAQSTVDEMGERLSTAELRIDGAESKIEAKADLILLDGYVKADELETSVLAVLQYADLSQADLDVGYLDAGSAQISTLDANSITTNSLSVGGVNLSSHSHAVSVNGGTVTLGEVSSTGGSFNIADTQFYKDGVSAAETAGYNKGMPNRATVSAGYNSISNVYSGTITVYSNDGTSHTYIMSPIDASDAYNAGYDDGESGVTLSASGWSGDENTITASNGETMTVKKHYSTKTTVSSGDTVFVSYNGAMVNATYRSGGSSFTYISNVTVA